MKQEDGLVATNYYYYLLSLYRENIHILPNPDQKPIQ